MREMPSLSQILDKLSALAGFTVSVELLLAVFTLAAFFIFLINFLRQRRLNRQYAQQSRRIVRELLCSSIDQRSTLELEFTSEEMRGRVLTGPCSSVEADVATVDVGLEHSLQSWVGEPLEISFKLDYKGAGTYYHFTSRVIGMRAGSRAVSIDLALPEHIQPMQKRRFVRISPLSSHILGMGLWSLDSALPLPLDSTTLGCAALSYRPGKLTQCSLLNISAGGMRVEVPPVLLNQLPAGFNLQSQILCLLLLRSPDNGQPMPFWLACAVVSLEEKDDAASNVVIGLKFKAWALSETGNSDIFWFPVGKSGEVSPLASWVLRHQLEQNKRRRE